MNPLSLHYLINFVPLCIIISANNLPFILLIISRCPLNLFHCLIYVHLVRKYLELTHLVFSKVYLTVD